MRLACLILCGCDSILKIHGVVPSDATYFDAPADAPYACPPTGMQPAFSQVITQHVFEPCEYYTFDVGEDLAFARCAIEGGMTRELEQGPAAASMLDKSVLGMPSSTSVSIGKLSPEGDELWVTENNTTTGQWTISVYVQSQPNTWSWSYDAYTIGTATGAPVPSTPTRAGPNRIVMYIVADMLYELVEQSPGTWTLMSTQSATFDLGLDSIADVNLSPDGLRIVIQGSAGPLVNMKFGAFYGDRARTDVPFSHVVPLDGVPDSVATPFLANDCGHLYFSALGNVWVTKLIGYSSH